MRTTIEFGGFYGSVHEAIVEGCVERAFCDDNGIVDWDNVEVDWHECNKNYMHEWTTIFEAWLKDEYGISIKFKNLELSSPRYYNYATDKIDCDLSKREATDIV